MLHTKQNKAKVKQRNCFNAKRKTCVCLQSRVYLGMPTLKDLILKRPSRQFQYLHVLLDLSSHEKEKVRYIFLLSSSFPFSL